MSLARVPTASRFRVTAVRPGHEMTYRLMEMGFMEGAEIELIRRAPLGDPLQVRIGDYELSIRAREAELVDVAAI